MSYTKRAFKQSPNYTPASQTAAFYGRPRTIEFGAGHWWDDPTRKPSFDGVVATLMNPNRQASAHAVVGDRVVQELVRAADTSWCTGNANPFTVSIETDPQIIYKWWSGGDKAKAERIFETISEYIADRGWHNLPWKPHKYWAQTGCNPIDWGAVMSRAKQIYKDKNAPAPSYKWVDMENPRTMVAAKDVRVYDLQAKAFIGSVIKKGTKVEFKTKALLNGKWYLRSKYSTDNKLNHGLLLDDFNEVPPPTPEWQKNLKDITPVKLTVLVAQTPIVDLNTGKTIKQLGQGTVIDFTKSTTVGGVQYLISSYSATQAMPNGIKRADVGVPAQPPVNEKPEWLKNWLDIEDVKMYARADTDLVNLEDGSTIKVIPRGTEIAVASTTEWHGQKYAITEYSTSKQLGQGIRIDDLDMKPVGDGTPTEPAPEQPSIEDNVNWLVKAVKAILAFFGIKV